MPTFHATGVTAKLGTCDLRSTLSNVIVLTMGAGHQKESARVRDIFANAQRLPERPVGEDGSEKGIIQFIGPNEDMPLYVVEVGENVGRRNQDEDDEMLDVPPMPRQHTVLSLSDDSTLTSLGETPTSTGLSATGVSPEKALKPTIAQPTPLALGQSMAARLASLDSGGEQALVLEIDLSPKSFLPESITPRNYAVGSKDLKIEVFLNGELVEVLHYPARKAPNGVEKVLLTGTRIHRQVQKPWVYNSSHNQVSSSEAADTWFAVSKALSREAEFRGRDHLGDQQPSAQFLSALAVYDLPTRFDQQKGIGVIDIILSAGTGKKYGPDTSYIAGPTRMKDPQYSTANPPLFDREQSAASFTMARSDNIMVQSFENHIRPSSPEISLREAHKLQVPSPSPPKKRVKDLVAELGIEGDPKTIKLDNYEKTNGRNGQGGRTLNQVLGNIVKMSPRNQATHIARLKAEMSGGDSEEEKRVTKKVKREQISSPKPQRRVARAMEDPFVDTEVLVAETGATMSPTDMHKVWPVETTPEPAIDPALTTDPDAVLTQNRIDMALGAGLPSNGALLRHIASTSPMKTPRKITTASSLTNSPISLPVKPQHRSRPPKTPTPQRHGSLLSRQDSPLTSIDLTPHISPTKKKGDRATTPSRSGPGANRTAERWEPKEPSIEDALRDFKAPKTCVGSCVTYAEDGKAQRQIPKARAGEFQEEVVVVGMRFVVVQRS
jgi:hypothetical protein